MLICFAFGMPLSTQAGQGSPEDFQLVQGGGKSLSEAVEQVRRQYKNGRIIDAETKLKGGREIHHVLVMINGKVKTVTVKGRKRGP